jgi:hypothetical protein
MAFRRKTKEVCRKYVFQMHLYEENKKKKEENYFTWIRTKNKAKVPYLNQRKIK